MKRFEVTMADLSDRVQQVVTTVTECKKAEEFSMPPLESAPLAA